MAAAAAALVSCEDEAEEKLTPPSVYFPDTLTRKVPFLVKKEKESSEGKEGEGVS